MESWGRKKRSIGSDGTKHKSSEGGKQVGDDMTLSREIVVLDLKEKTSNEQAALDSASNSDLTSGDQSLLSADSSTVAQKLQRSPRGGSGGGGRAPNVAASQSMGDDHQGGDALDAMDKQPNMHCLSSQSLLLLICSVGLFFVLYVCLVAYFFSRRDPKISVIKHQYH